MAYEIFKKLEEELAGVKKNVLMKNCTTYKIGGPAKYFFSAKTKENLVRALKAAKSLKLQVFILGGGSNLLVSEKGFKGLVIKIDIKNINFQEDKVMVGAGTDLTKLSYQLAEAGLSGLEWATGIPSATVGGAIFGHAQAFGQKISDTLESVEILDTKKLKFKIFTKNQCRFSLKNSIFKKNKSLIIISAVFLLKKSDKKEIQNKIKEFLNYRKSCHPIDFPSAGSVFVNPEIKGEVVRAGSLIEKCGLKGKRVGGAQISEKHANFIINLSNARAKDVLSLINLAKKKVKQTFGINLETEVQLLGF